MELYDPKGELQTFSQGGSYRPEQAPDVARSIERQYANYNRQLQYFERSRQTNQATKLANAKQTGQDLVALGSFSKAAAEFGGKILERVTEANEINETYDALFGEAPDSPEQAEVGSILQAGEEQAEEVARVTERVEQQEGTQAAEVVRSRIGGLTQAATGDRTRAIQASTSYGSYLTGYLDSDASILVNGRQIPIREAARSANPGLRVAAMAQARQQFIKDFDLRSVSKRNLVRYLAPQVINSEASVGASLAAAGTKERRQAEIQTATAVGYELGKGKLNANSAQAAYEEVSNQFRQRDTGLSRQAANEAGIKALIAGAVASGNPDAIEALDTVKYNPNGGNERTNQIGGRYRYLLDEGIAQAKRTRNTRNTALKSELENQMYKELAPVQDEAARGAIVENYALQLENSGLYKDADKLRGKWKELTAPGGQERNEALVADQIENGSITEVSQLEELRRKNEISRKGFEDLKKKLETAATTAAPKDPSGKSIAKDWADNFSTTFTQAAGLKRDAYGNVVDSSRGETVLVDSGTAKLIIGQAERDINLAANTWLRQNTGLSEEKKQAGLQKLMKEWWQSNVLDKSGKYYLGDILGRQGSSDRNRKKFSAEERDRFQNLVQDPEKLSKLQAGKADLTPQDFTSVINPGSDISAQDRANFNPLRRDKAFSQLEIESAAANYENGVLDDTLVTTARQLGMTPLAFLNQQLGAYGLDPVPLPSRSNADVRTSLMTFGVSANAAEVIAGMYPGQSTVEVTTRIEAALRAKPELRSVLTSGYATPRTIRGALSALNPPVSNATPFSGVLSLLRSGEGGYDSANRGYAGDTPGGVPGLSSKTLGEWKALQRSGYVALGAYQFIPSTLVMAARELGISDSTVMNTQVQDRLAIQLMTGSKRPVLAAYLRGDSNDIDAALDDLALEWASVATRSGGTAYPDVGGNAASISRGSARQQLIALRKALVGGNQ